MKNGEKGEREITFFPLVFCVRFFSFVFFFAFQDKSVSKDKSSASGFKQSKASGAREGRKEHAGTKTPSSVVGGKDAAADNDYRLLRRSSSSRSSRPLLLPLSSPSCPFDDTPTRPRSSTVAGQEEGGR